ncbi:MAG: hypothetical protein LW854_19480 [Rubrivivax sp.]|jgi:hypothetical protein|nr:hypothetical protein [Rubrivivax sp.]
MTPQRGLFELTMRNAQTSLMSFDDVVIDAVSRGVPPEVITRLKGIWEQTKVIAGEVVAIGRIIVREIVNFLRQHPRIALGIALGAAVTALIGGIPFVGPLLQPFSLWLGTFYAAGVGAAMEMGDYSGSPFTAAIELAKHFFELITRIFRSVVAYLVS